MTRQSIGLLKKIAKLLEEAKMPSEIDRANIALARDSYSIARASIVVSAIFSIIGVALIIVQIKSSVEVKNLNRLIAEDSAISAQNMQLVNLYRLELNDMKTLLSASQSQLEVNSKTQEITNKNFELTQIGSMYALKNTIHEIEESYHGGNGPRIQYAHDFKYLDDYCDNLISVKKLFLSQINNPYVNSSDTIQTLWMKSLGLVGEEIRQLQFFISLNGRDYYNISTGKYNSVYQNLPIVDEFFKTEGDMQVYEAVIAATKYSFFKIRRDRVLKGLLNKNGDYKLNVLDFWNGANGKTVAQEMQEKNDSIKKHKR